MTTSAAYIRTSDAARILGLSKKTLEKLRVTGGGPRYYKLGRAVRYVERDLRSWADAGARTSTSDPGGDAEGVAS